MTEIRQVELDDLEDLSAVFKKDGQEHSKPLERYPIAEWVMHPEVIFLTAVSKKPCGFIVVRLAGDEAKVDLLSVAETHHGKGMEQELIRAVEKLTQGFTLKMYAQRNCKPLMTALKNAGFSMKNEVRDLYGEGKHAALMVKKVEQRKRSAPKNSGQVKVKHLFKGVYTNEEAEHAILEKNLQKLDIHFD
ncbi:hypothetical protein HY640_01220 [Candidatus Woesearchaeota archaeon]|nr:hypothetical protein [Candidatus Woesearchaeota archaeon]